MKKYIFLLILLSIISINIGVSDFSYDNLIYSRIPRLISILMVGTGLSISGLIMQQISQNKFASPSTTGTVESAGLGIVLSMLFFTESDILFKALFGFIFAMIGTRIFLSILNNLHLRDPLFIPLLGLMLGKVVLAITTLIGYKYDLLQGLGSWLYGDFSAIIKGKYELLFIGIPMVIIAYIYSTRFNIIGIGKDFSRNVGLNYNTTRDIGLTIISVLSSITIVIVGQIPFIGLIVPNIVYILYGENLKHNIPYIAIFGSIFVLICDILSRVILYPYEISVSLVTDIIGSVVFLYLIYRSKNND